ncbi:hypothetical protein OF001_U160014 [Pseudomonas sp. OF001]|nr:hypothetical protein OF001_U160014 [Pseudomonas sp. OF001]
MRLLPLAAFACPGVPDETVPRPDAPRARDRHLQGRPYRHRHLVGVRPPDALRPGRRLPAGDHQEVPPEIHHPRAAVVPQGRDQHPLPQGKRRLHLGRVGRRERRAGPGVRLPVAQLAGAQRRVDRPDRQPDRDDPEEPRLAPADRLRVEPGAGRADGPAAVPRAVPVLRRRRQALLPAVPALGGHLPRRAVQHRQLRPADDDGGAGLRPRARRVRLDRRRLPPVRQPSGADRPAAVARAPAAAADEAEPDGEGPVRLPLRGLRAGRLPEPPAHQGAGGGLTPRMHEAPRGSCRAGPRAVQRPIRG